MVYLHFSIIVFLWLVPRHLRARRQRRRFFLTTQASTLRLLWSFGRSWIHGVCQLVGRKPFHPCSFLMPYFVTSLLQQSKHLYDRQRSYQGRSSSCEATCAFGILVFHQCTVKLRRSWKRSMDVNDVNVHELISCRRSPDCEFPSPRAPKKFMMFSPVPQECL